MLRVENIPWADLGPKEKRVFEVCGQIMKWTHRDWGRMNFCESLRLIDRANLLFERFGQRPYYYRRHKLIEDFWDAELLFQDFLEVKNAYGKRSDLRGNCAELRFDPQKETLEEIMIKAKKFLMPGARLRLFQKYREDDEIEIMIYVSPDKASGSSMVITEKTLPFSLNSSPHLGISRIDELLKDEAVDIEESPFERIDLDFYDHFHPNEVAQKTINLAGIENIISLIKITGAVIAQIIATPRKFS